MSTSYVDTSGGVAQRGELDSSGGVVDTPLTAPTTVLSRNVGNGSLEVTWVAATGPVDHYDLYVAEDPADTFVQANLEDIEGTRFVVPNLPLGTTVYVKVKAVDANGTESAFSALARDAYAVKARALLRFSGPVGEEITDGALFTCPIDGELLGLRLASGGTIS